MSSDSEIGKIRKADCSECGGERNCEVLGHHQQRGGDDNYAWCTTWFILVCRGCEHVFIQTHSTNSEDYYDYYDEEGEHQREHNEVIQYWPARSKRELPDWMTAGGIEAEGDKIDRLSVSMRELYGALDSDLNMLAAIGIRTSFDIAAELLGAEERLPFEKKLTFLVEHKIIREAERDHLAVLVDAGSASAHRGWKPTSEELNTLMETIESFIYDSFVVPKRRNEAAQKIAKMKENVPPRAIRASASNPVPGAAQNISKT